MPEPRIVSSKRAEAEAEAEAAGRHPTDRDPAAGATASTGSMNRSDPLTTTPPVDDLPVYEEIGDPSVASPPPGAGPVPSSPPGEAPPPAAGAASPSAAGPSIANPFNFPVDAPLPPYSPPQGLKRRFIVAPQVAPDPASPFLPVFSPRLTAHGITEPTFLAFLDTLSAFLTAKVSDRAIAHAGDVAREVGLGTVSSFKEIVSHTKHVGKHIGARTKKGDVVGAFFGAVGGAVSIPVTAAMGLVTAVVTLPGSAISAAAKTPQTQRARAEAYLAVANRDWFAARGLRGFLMDTAELGRKLGEDVQALFALPGAAKAVDAHEQMKVLAGKVADVEVWASAPRIEVKGTNLWVVLVEKEEGDDLPIMA